MDTNTRVGRSFAVFGSFWPGKAACAVALGIGLLSGCGGGDVADDNAGAQEAQMEPLGRSPRKGDGNKHWPTSTPETSTTTTTTTPTTTSPTTSTTTTTTTTTSPTGTVPVSDRAPLGVNIEGLWDWARLQPFVDLMKTSRPWGTPDAPWDEAAQVDALGWPTADAGVVVNVRTYEPGDETKAYRYMTPGVYQLRFTGRASVGPSASTDVVIRNYTYDSATNRSHAEVVVGTAATQLMLTFRNTVGGVRDVSLRMPGYDDAQTFTNQFIQALTPFQVVRFMDFLRTNNNPVRTWAERTTPASGSQISPRGAAHEYAIQVANQLGKDIWINVPALADDAYVRSLATLLKQSLAPGRVVYVEYSNELWNFQFSQTTANMQLAVAEAVAGDTTLTRGQPCTQEMFNAGTGECNSYWAGYFRVGKRTVRIAQIFSEVFGAPAMNNQVRVVYATQFVNPGIAEQVLKNIATYRAQPSSLLYGVATAPYFYLAHDLVGSTVATKEQLLQSMETSLRTDVEPYFAAGVMNQGVFVRGPYTGGNYTGASHKALADYYGLKSLAYEGGPDFGQNAANTTTKIAANRELKMGELVKSEVTQWFGCGNDLYMYFSLSSAWDRHGYWGLTNDPTDLNTPKYAAVRDVAQTARSSLTTCR